MACLAVDMPVSIAFLCKGPITERADVVLFTGVDSKMVLQISTFVKVGKAGLALQNLFQSASLFIKNSSVGVVLSHVVISNKFFR